MKIAFSNEFLVNLKQLRKKYRNVEKDIQPTIDQLKNGEIVGDRLQREDGDIYKVRIRNSDTTKGKSGGYRLLYYLYLEDTITLVAIYSKLGK